MTAELRYARPVVRGFPFTREGETGSLAPFLSIVGRVTLPSRRSSTRGGSVYSICQHVSCLSAYWPSCQSVPLCACGSVCWKLQCICFLEPCVARAKLPVTMVVFWLPAEPLLNIRVFFRLA